MLYPSAPLSSFAIRQANRFVSPSPARVHRFSLPAQPSPQSNAPRAAATWMPQVSLAHSLATASLSRAPTSTTDHALRRWNPQHQPFKALSLEPLSAAKWPARPLCRRLHRSAMALSAKTAPGSGGGRRWPAAAVASARPNATTLCRHRRRTRCFGA